MVNPHISDDKIRAYALKNAVEHGGKCQAGSVLSPLFVEGLKKEDVKSIMPKINEIVKKVNSLSPDEQKTEFEKSEKKVSHRDVREEGELPELENVDKKKGVVMRFAPSPSGPLHIGHAATGMPSSLYVKKYSGKFYIRIEDTNPENIDPEAYKMIPEEADWLFGNVSEIVVQSDRMQKYYDFAKKLIEKDAAYICDCDAEKFKALIDEKKECPCRKLKVKDNLERWKKMMDPSGFKEGEAVLRFKSNLNEPNPAMRDFPLARINTAEHPRQKKKYRVWPLMNLSVTVDDIDLGSTHIIRAKEHMDNAKRQEMMMKVFNIKPPKAYFLGRYKFDDLEISCSKTKKLINEGKFSGWSDIRLPFMAALKRRGFQPGAFANMATKRGISEVDRVMSEKDYFTELSNFNREILHDMAVKASFEWQKKKAKGCMEILMPDAAIVYGKSDIRVAELKDGQIIHFFGLGYCRYNKEEKVKMWFSHP